MYIPLASTIIQILLIFYYFRMLLCSRREFLYIFLEILYLILHSIIKLARFELMVTAKFLLKFIHIFIIVKVFLSLILKGWILVLHLSIVHLLTLPVHIQVIHRYLLHRYWHVRVHILIMFTGFSLEKLSRIYLKNWTRSVRWYVNISSLVVFIKLEHP